MFNDGRGFTSNPPDPQPGSVTCSYRGRLVGRPYDTRGLGPKSKLPVFIDSCREKCGPVGQEVQLGRTDLEGGGAGGDGFNSEVNSEKEENNGTGDVNDTSETSDSESSKTKTSPRAPSWLAPQASRFAVANCPTNMLKLSCSCVDGEGKASTTSSSNDQKSQTFAPLDPTSHGLKQR